MYFEFMTDKKVVLKQFDLVPELFNMANEIGTITNYIKSETLSSLYNRFERTHRGKKVLRLIKENILE